MSTSTVMEVYCWGCGKFLREIDGKGKEGRSHGLCQCCANTEYLKAMGFEKQGEFWKRGNVSLLVETAECSTFEFIENFVRVADRRTMERAA
jgi:hypothetical protein